MGRKLWSPPKTGHKAWVLTRTLTSDGQEPDVTGWYLVPFSRNGLWSGATTNSSAPLQRHRPAVPQKTCKCVCCLCGWQRLPEAVASPVHACSLKSSIPSVSFPDSLHDKELVMGKAQSPLLPWKGNHQELQQRFFGTRPENGHTTAVPDPSVRI